MRTGWPAAGPAAPWRSRASACSSSWVAPAAICLDRQGRGPSLRGVYGSRVQLAGGQTVLADDAYIRESILNPNAKIVAGYKPNVMPSFQGQITEEGILQLVVYIKSLALPTRRAHPDTATGNHRATRNRGRRSPARWR